MIRRLLNILQVMLFSAAAMISCSREPVPPPEPVIGRITISQLREMYEQGNQYVDTNVFIQGKISLTPEFKNIPSFVAYIQDSTAGICLTVTGTNTYSMNSEVKILCRGIGFTDYNGLLQFGDISIADQSELVNLSPTPPEPITVTLDDLLAGKHQGEYVRIEGVQFRESGTFSGSNILTDCISVIDVYTRQEATFASELLPEGNGTFRGIASVYTSKQILLRDPSELEMTGNRCGVPSVTYVTQDFNSLTTNYTNVDVLAGWKTYSEAGTKTWYSNKITSLGPWIQTTAYNSNQATVTTWMIAPQVDLTASVNPYVQFESANGYDNGATLELFVSSDYTGSSTPWFNSWTKLAFNLPPSTNPSYSDFVSSGQVDLSVFNGSTIYIAWVYKGGDLTGTANDKTTTWEVDNIIIAEK